MLVRACKINAWKRQKELEKILTKSFLFKEYITNCKSPGKIAKELSCGITSIYNYLRKYNIIFRTASESAKIRDKDSLIRLHIYKNKQYIKIEYLENLKPIHSIAKKLKCSYKCLRDCMIEMQIPVRNKTQCQSGSLNHAYGKYNELNPNWQGGLSRLPYSIEFTEKLRSEIRKRDNDCCQICHMTKKKHFQRYHHQMPIHHIDYNKQNADKKNLITLCKKCHTRTNFNRDYWYAYCVYIMENFYE